MHAKHSSRDIARHFGRSVDTVSREISRHTINAQYCYDASLAGFRAHVTRRRARRTAKLHPDSQLFELVTYLLRKYWSPRQIARDHLQCALCDASWLSLKKLIACLLQGNGKRRPRRRGNDKHQQILELVSIHMQPPDIEDRLMLGHWEGDLTMGANNQSAVGTLVERTIRLVMLVKLDGTTTAAAALGFSDKLNEVPKALRLSTTYDQGREMVKHAEITQRTETAIYFSDPHSPWQRGSNKNINGLLWQYLPKGTNFIGVQPRGA